MPTRSPKIARRALPAVASLAALGALAALPTAGSADVRHIPGVGNGVQLTTDAPDLRNATIVSGNRVRYCFDETISTVAAAQFYVLTYDSTRFLQASGGQVDVDNSACAIVQFPGNADLSQGTIGQIGPDAVADSANERSYPASEPLGGSSASPRAGATTGPDLTGVTADRNANSLTFTFDEALAAGTADAANFRFTNESGQTVAGASAAISGASVTVAYPASAPVGAAARALVRAGAVTDVAQSGSFIAGRAATTPNGADSFRIKDVGAATVASVTANGATTVNVKYDQFVDLGNRAAFQAVLDDGTTVTASDAVRSQADASTVVVTFPDALGTEAAAVVRIVDLGGGATVNGAASSVSAVAVNAVNNSPGFTNAPDLLSAKRDDATNRVVYTFDEAVGAASGPAFFGVAASGGRITPTGATPSTAGSTATVTFTAANRTSTGAGLNDGGAIDSLGHPSPFSAVSYADEQAPPAPPTTTTGTTPVPPPVVTPPATVKPRTSTSVSIRRTKTRITGTVKNSGRGCIVGRRVSLKRIGRSKALKTVSTNSKGVYRFKRTKSTRGKKVRVTVAARTGTYAICGAKTSKTIRG